MPLSMGERLKDARLLHNINGKETLDAVADATNVSKSLISELENGETNRSVGYDKIMKLAQHYGVSVDWILGLSEVRSLNPTVQAAVQYTGLSEKAVDYFHWESQDPETMSILNQLFEARIEDLHRLAVTIMLVNKTHSAIPKHHFISPCPETEEGKEEYQQQTELGNVYLPPREAAKFFRQEVEREFGRLLDKTIFREELD